MRIERTNTAAKFVLGGAVITVSYDPDGAKHRYLYVIKGADFEHVNNDVFHTGDVPQPNAFEAGMALFGYLGESVRQRRGTEVFPENVVDWAEKNYQAIGFEEIMPSIVDYDDSGVIGKRARRISKTISGIDTPAPSTRSKLLYQFGDLCRDMKPNNLTEAQLVALIDVMGPIVAGHGSG